MQAQMRGSRVAVEILGKSSNKGSLLAMPEDASASGVILLLGKDLASSDLKVGQKVYFGKNHHQLRMEGRNVLVMDEDNVYAIAEDSNAAEDGSGTKSA